MPDEIIPNKDNEGTVGDPPAVVEKKEEPPNPEVAELRAKYTELENFAKGAVQRAERADSYVAQMTASLQVAANRVPQHDPNQGQPGMDVRERLMENPQEVLDAHFNARTGPILATATENSARLNRELSYVKFQNQVIPGTDKSLIDIYGDEVDTFMNNLPAATRASAGSYESAMRWVRSQHIDDEVKMRIEAINDKEKRSFMETPSGVGAPPNAKKSLSDIERTVAKGLGLSEDEYTTYRDNPTGA